ITPVGSPAAHVAVADDTATAPTIVTTNAKDTRTIRKRRRFIISTSPIPPRPPLPTGRTHYSPIACLGQGRRPCCGILCGALTGTDGRSLRKLPKGQGGLQVKLLPSTLRPTHST